MNPETAYIYTSLQEGGGGTDFTNILGIDRASSVKHSVVWT